MIGQHTCTLVTYFEHHTYHTISYRRPTRHTRQQVRTCAACAVPQAPNYATLTAKALTCVSKNPLYSGVERPMLRVRCHSSDSLLWLYDYIAVRNYITTEDVTTTERVLRHLCACYDHYQAFAAVKPPLLSLAILFPLQPSRIWQWRLCVGACCCCCC